MVVSRGFTHPYGLQVAGAEELLTISVTGNSLTRCRPAAPRFDVISIGRALSPGWRVCVHPHDAKDGV